MTSFFQLHFSLSRFSLLFQFSPSSWTLSLLYDSHLLQVVPSNFFNFRQRIYNEVLCEFFNAMVISIWLLRLKGQPATLSKLAKSIESLTDTLEVVNYTDS
ncbi:uncharacterized protein [Spinacia oleracea]|uniref:Uncharacterized protein n=1 Tax=Spinacia oleracea TaxID=3562 RepID=A0ABM3QPD7_SPIOL|nr:uncharacterized protein LOC110786973 [Spinacia oleracea]